MRLHKTTANAMASGPTTPTAHRPKRYTERAVERRLLTILEPYLTDVNAQVSTYQEWELDGRRTRADVVEWSGI